MPSILGGGEVGNVRPILGPDGNLDHVQGGGIELSIHHFSSCGIAWINGLEAILDDSPQFI
jgi:hypothetical protein